MALTEQDEDKKLIADEDLWPQWPLLPLIHKTRKGRFLNQCGVLVGGNGLKVYLDVNIFSPNNLPTAEIQEYGTVEELLNDWRID